MENEHDTTKNRRGSSPQQGAEHIYHEWLKRPRSSGEQLEDQAKKGPKKTSSDAGLSDTEPQ